MPCAGDFVNLWVSGRLILEGALQTFFDHEAYQDALASAVRARSCASTCGRTRQQASCSRWARGADAVRSRAGGFGHVPALPHSSPLARAGLGQKEARLITLLLLFAPATLLNIICGQNGFYSHTAALFAGTILMLDSRPILAGVLCGLLSYKPHLGIVIAPALRTWRMDDHRDGCRDVALSRFLASMALFRV